MNARIGLLTALLGVQCLIIAAVLLADGAGGEPRPALLDFDPEAVDEIRFWVGHAGITQAPMFLYSCFCCGC